MLDYYGSILQQKKEIYSEIISRFSDYNESYITSKLDMLYDSKFLTNEVSKSGWMVFVGPEVVKKINESIHEDFQISRRKLLLAQWLHKNKDCNYDMMELISSYIQ